MIYEYTEKDNEGNIIERVSCDDYMELLRTVLIYKHRTRIQDDLK